MLKRIVPVLGFIALVAMVAPQKAEAGLRDRIQARRAARQSNGCAIFPIFQRQYCQPQYVQPAVQHNYCAPVQRYERQYYKTVQGTDCWGRPITIRYYRLVPAGQGGSVTPAPVKPAPVKPAPDKKVPNLNDFPEKKKPELNDFPDKKKPELNDFPGNKKPELNDFPGRKQN